jgi:hypothetical protein
VNFTEDKEANELIKEYQAHLRPAEGGAESVISDTPKPQTILKCPSCGIEQDLDEVIITSERIMEAGRNSSIKTTVRSRIRLEAFEDDDGKPFSATCLFCGDQWQQ